MIYNVPIVRNNPGLILPDNELSNFCICNLTEQRLKFRIELIRHKATTVIRELKVFLFLFSTDLLPAIYTHIRMMGLCSASLRH